MNMKKYVAVLCICIYVKSAPIKNIHNISE